MNRTSAGITRPSESPSAKVRVPRPMCRRPEHRAARKLNGRDRSAIHSRDELYPGGGDEVATSRYSSIPNAIGAESVSSNRPLSVAVGFLKGYTSATITNRMARMEAMMMTPPRLPDDWQDDRQAVACLSPSRY
jgi:hypothetical protein